MYNNAPTPYACDPAKSAGRVVHEPESTHRTAYQRDRDRIIHSSAFRRLKHKTQVFVAGYGDHFRTRLTHSLEVAQIARALARTLGVNEDLTEGIALAHDLGHPPFAHKGEDALAVCMAPFGGFKHNDQTVRVVTHLEHRYAAFRGLNLTAETLEGLAKHNGPVHGDTSNTIKELIDVIDIQPDLYTPLEAQIVDIADDTAYSNHDVEDGLRAKCFSLNDLKGLSLYSDVVPEFERALSGHPPDVIRGEIIRAQIGRMVDDILETTQANLAAINPKSVDDIRRAGQACVRFSPGMFAMVKELREFLFTNMYGSPPLRVMARHAEDVIAGLFDRFMTRPELLPPEWHGEFENLSGGDAAHARLVADYIAGMTDGYAEQEWERLKG
jgi:dGTPase